MDSRNFEDEARAPETLYALASYGCVPCASPRRWRCLGYTRASGGLLVRICEVEVRAAWPVYSQASWGWVRERRHSQMDSRNFEVEARAPEPVSALASGGVCHMFGCPCANLRALMEAYSDGGAKLRILSAHRVACLCSSETGVSMFRCPCANLPLAHFLEKNPKCRAIESSKRTFAAPGDSKTPPTRDISPMLIKKKESPALIGDEVRKKKKLSPNELSGKKTESRPIGGEVRKKKNQVRAN